MNRGGVLFNSWREPRWKRWLLVLFPSRAETVSCLNLRWPLKQPFSGRFNPTENKDMMHTHPSQQVATHTHTHTHTPVGWHAHGTDLKAGVDACWAHQWHVNEHEYVPASPLHTQREMQIRTDTHTHTHTYSHSHTHDCSTENWAYFVMYYGSQRTYSVERTQSVLHQNTEKQVMIHRELQPGIWTLATKFPFTLRNVFVICIC